MPLISNATVTRVRYTAGTRDSEGRYVAAIESAGDFSASVQGPDGQDLQTLPEGDRTKTVHKVYIDTDVRAADQHAGTQADQLIIDGAVYEVRKVWPWRAESLIPHHKCLAVRVKE